MCQLGWRGVLSGNLEYLIGIISLTEEKDDMVRLMLRLPTAFMDKR